MQPQLWTCIPFLLCILSVALCPMLISRIWKYHYDVIMVLCIGFAAIFMVSSIPMEFVWRVYGHSFLEMVDEFFGFLSLVGSLFVITGGIYISGSFSPTPLVNTIWLAVGTMLASCIGTTGASMLLIRPLLASTASRFVSLCYFPSRLRFRRLFQSFVPSSALLFSVFPLLRHWPGVAVVFFIFLVSNVGGCLSPIGDPPLFLGFLEGVPFFWFAKHVWVEVLFIVVCVLLLFFIIDSVLYQHENPDESSCPCCPSDASFLCPCYPFEPAPYEIADLQATPSNPMDGVADQGAGSDLQQPLNQQQQQQQDQQQPQPETRDPAHSFSQWTHYLLQSLLFPSFLHPHLLLNLFQEPQAPQPPMARTLRLSYFLLQNSLLFLLLISCSRLLPISFLPLTITAWHFHERPACRSSRTCVLYLPTRNASSMQDSELSTAPVNKSSFP